MSGGTKKLYPDYNQEIVIRFFDHAVQNDTSKDVIADITQRLKSMGIRKIQIVSLSENRLKILYYSPIEVEDMEKALNEEQLPSDRPVSSDLPGMPDHYYDIQIVKVQEKQSDENSIEGLLAEIRPIPDRYFKNSSNILIVFLQALAAPPVIEENFGNRENISLKKDLEKHYLIPEVRAGPWA